MKFSYYPTKERVPGIPGYGAAQKGNAIYLSLDEP